MLEIKPKIWSGDGSAVGSTNCSPFHPLRVWSVPIPSTHIVAPPRWCGLRSQHSRGGSSRPRGRGLSCQHSHSGSLTSLSPAPGDSTSPLVPVSTEGMSPSPNSELFTVDHTAVVLTRYGWHSFLSFHVTSHNCVLIKRFIVRNL